MNILKKTLLASLLLTSTAKTAEIKGIKKAWSIKNVVKSEYPFNPDDKNLTQGETPDGKYYFLAVENQEILEKTGNKQKARTLYVWKS